MTDFLPAWSEPFHDGTMLAVPRLPAGITREWAYGDGSGRGVRVAVIDSGIDADHPMVGGVQEHVEVTIDGEGDAVFRSDPHGDLYGHGTACAAIVRSLAPAAELVSVRVLGANLKGSAWNFANGLDWCIEHGVHVANLSLSTTNEDFAETFYDLLDQAHARGMVIVSAMNNEPRRSIPSEFAGVLSVACAPVPDREHFVVNGDSPAEWGALGMDVDVAWSGNDTLNVSGNSFAAPVLVGHVARVLGAHPGLRPWQVRTILAELADPGA
jgi:subtilisin